MQLKPYPYKNHKHAAFDYFLRIMFLCYFVAAMQKHISICIFLINAVIALAISCLMAFWADKFIYLAWDEKNLKARNSKT